MWMYVHKLVLNYTVYSLLPVIREKVENKFDRLKKYQLSR